MQHFNCSLKWSWSVILSDERRPQCEMKNVKYSIKLWHYPDFIKTCMQEKKIVKIYAKKLAIFFLRNLFFIFLTDFCGSITFIILKMKFFPSIFVFSFITTKSIVFPCTWHVKQICISRRAEVSSRENNRPLTVLVICPGKSYLTKLFFLYKNLCKQ